MVDVAFSDSGPGIDQASCEIIFDPFFTTREGGIGLGLSVARSIVDNHNGVLSVQSTEGKGSTFTVSIPIPTCEPPSENPVKG